LPAQILLLLRAKRLRAIWRNMQLVRTPLLKFALAILAGLFVLVTSSVAHAVLLESSPSLKGTIAGPDVPIKLRFNVRIDAGRSRLTLVRPDGSTRLLEISKQSPADSLYAGASGLAPGDYRIRWQVLASDGHITRGEIPFSVTHA
jgi:methionine-rich copper-binding protein CopC